MEVMGLMLGDFVDEYTVKVVDVFAMPQSGTGVSVEAVDPVFQTTMLDMLKQVRPPCLLPFPVLLCGHACTCPRGGAVECTEASVSSFYRLLILLNHPRFPEVYHPDISQRCPSEPLPRPQSSVLPVLLLSRSSFMHVCDARTFW